jgi:hypothetical protein
MVLPDMREIVMTHAGHGIWKCSCGQVVKQCRCPDKNKPVHIVQNGCDACHTMTTPTTQTAPLIERIRDQINYLDAVAEYDVRGNAELRQGIADLRSLLNDAFDFYVGDGIWIEREQARETLRNVVEVLENNDENYWPGADEIADASVAALAGEERP